MLSVRDGIWGCLSLPGLKNCVMTLVQFLDQQQLEKLLEVATHEDPSSFLVQLSRITLFVRRFHNRVDRSMYYTFYEEKCFLEMERESIAKIAYDHARIFKHYPQQYKSLFQAMAAELPPAQTEFEIDRLQQLLFSPDIPMPRMRRQTVGIGCNSTFQYFLVDLRFGKGNNDFDEFQRLKEFFQSKDSVYTKQFYTIRRQQKDHPERLKTIKQVRLTGYEITYRNHAQFLLEGNELHNFIVRLLAITDIWVESTSRFMELIDDPLQKLVELMLRYSLFKNYVIAIEVRSSCRRKHFTLCSPPTVSSMTTQSANAAHLFSSGDLPWPNGSSQCSVFMVQLMSCTPCAQPACVCNISSPANSLHNNKQPLCRSAYILSLLRNKLQQRQFEMYLSDKINQSKCSRVLEEYFNSSTELYEIMVVECMEYMIDLSINELTVHWCGHSELELAQQPYEQFEEDFLKYNHCFMDHLISLYDGDKAMLRNLLQDQVEFLERIAVKPTTLKKIIANTNQTYHLLLEDQPLFMDFQTKDRQLKYFNEKAFILESIDQSQKPFFSIPPLCSTQDLLRKSIQTNCTQNDDECSSEQELQQYHSEDESGNPTRKCSYLQDAIEIECDCSESQSISNEELQVDLKLGFKGMSLPQLDPPLNRLYYQKMSLRVPPSLDDKWNSDNDNSGIQQIIQIRGQSEERSEQICQQLFINVPPNQSQLIFEDNHEDALIGHTSF